MRICLVSVLAVAALFIVVLGVPTHHLRAIGGGSGLAPNEIAIFVDEDVEMDESGFDDGWTGDANIDTLGTTYGGCDRVKPLFPGSAPKTLRNQEVVDLSRWYKIRFNENQQRIDLAASAYEALDEIEIAETITRTIGAGSGSPTETPNDPEFSSMWHLDQTSDHDIDAPEAWAIETGDEDIIIAILDSGVDYHNDDFDGNIWSNDDETDNNDTDDDGNGYIDDVRGWDFVDDSSGEMGCPLFNIPGLDYIDADKDPMDQFGHGTECSSTIICINNNNTDLSAIAGGWGDGTTQSEGNGVKVMPCRVGAHMCGVGMDFVAEALYYAAANGAQIASLSVGTEFHSFLEDALKYFLLDQDQERLIFVMAENRNQAPACYFPNISGTLADYILTVAGTDDADEKYYNSSYGSVVDISAPAEDLTLLSIDNTILYDKHGTSFATPMAAGVAGLIWSRFPALGAADVRDRLFHGAEEIAVYQGQMGAGRINAYRSITEFGHITENTTWGQIEDMPNTIYVSGDLVIDDGATLTINPGTVIKVACEDEEHDSDDGLYANRVEIIVKGTLAIGTVGTGDIVFEAHSDDPGDDEWAGIRWTDGTSADIDMIIVRNASPAIAADEVDFESDDGNEEKTIYLNASLALDGTYTVDEDASLYILADTDVEMEAGATNKIEVDGTIVSMGATGSIPVFTSDVEYASDWVGIVLTSSSHDNVIEHTVLKHHQTGIHASNTDVLISNVEFYNGIIGIQVDQSTTGLIEECTIGSHPIGIVNVASSGTDIKHCSISGSTTYGVYCLNGANNELYANEIENCNFGLYCYASSPLVEWNTIQSNGIGVSILEGSNPDLGNGSQGSVGNNSILSNTSYHIVNLNTSVTIMAEDNWWGSSEGPKSSKISGSVDYEPPLPSAPGSPPAMAGGGDYEPPEREETPTCFAISAVNPNPFNPTTVVTYAVPASGGHVRINVYDVNGRLVRTLVDDHRSEGYHRITWDGTDNQARSIASGVYFLLMKVADYAETKKLILLR